MKAFLNFKESLKSLLNDEIVRMGSISLTVILVFSSLLVR